MWRAEDRPTIPSRIKVALHHWHMFYSCGAALARHNRHTRACRCQLPVRRVLRSHIPSYKPAQAQDSQKKKWGDAAQIQQDIRYKYKTHGTFLCGGGLLPTKSPSVIVPIYLIPIRPSVHLPAHAVLVC